MDVAILLVILNVGYHLGFAKVFWDINTLFCFCDCVILLMWLFCWLLWMLDIILALFQCFKTTRIFFLKSKTTLLHRLVP
ncbi:hypothetical protein JHK82_012469 [Glycine max]|uniref:Uncharacterized protein n=2 Tax=Glycine subgen. Soja TaxID=1462606 RepID=K7KPA8_SOYBN|nr:hypothetical protein JHK85_012825 [Glycine max]KHN02634.1 hypothetical protein glysoja_040458 [Glycine soja]KAG5154500.1 hypothetical protein JHK82_012469 [Glycine max]KAH1133654.1 hypothetical protein GYH30_012181 [Glycine max]KRH58001.1 hypothetical protein GLYMA_05G099800v4 [Glycine max]